MCGTPSQPTATPISPPSSKAQQEVDGAARSTDDLRWPDFLVIGAQKAGTTWLWKQLRTHPQVRIPPKKEIHFFDREILSKSLHWYQQQVADPNGTAVVRGEKTPCYAHLKARSIRLIRELMPNVKVVLLLREPAERAWSQARMEISQFNKRELTVRDTMRCIFNTGLLRNRRRTDYRRIVENWLSVFPEDQVFIGFYDQIELQPTALLQRICSFLGVEDHSTTAGSTPSDRVWKSPSMSMPRSVRWYLNRRYRRTTEWIGKRFTATPDSWSSQDACSDTCSLWEKTQVLFTADIATVPYNLLYTGYDLIRDVRLAKRIRKARREVGLSSGALSSHRKCP